MAVLELVAAVLEPHGVDSTSVRSAITGSVSERPYSYSTSHSTIVMPEGALD